MEVHHRLAGGFSQIHADVVAVGVEPAVEEGFCLPDEGEEGGVFRVGRVEVGGDVVEEDEEVAGARGVLSFQPLDPSHSTGTPDPADKPFLPEHRILLARLKKMIGITQHHAYITHHKSRFPRSIHVLLK